MFPGNVGPVTARYAVKIAVQTARVKPAYSSGRVCQTLSAWSSFAAMWEIVCVVDHGSRLPKLASARLGVPEALWDHEWTDEGRRVSVRLPDQGAVEGQARVFTCGRGTFAAAAVWEWGRLRCALYREVR